MKNLLVIAIVFAAAAAAAQSTPSAPSFPTPLTVKGHAAPPAAAPSPGPAPSVPAAPSDAIKATPGDTVAAAPGVAPTVKHGSPAFTSKPRIAPDSALQYDTSTKRWSSGTYTYDGVGNITNVGTDAYTYDQVSRLRSGVVRSTGSHTQSATYDPFGNITTITTDGVTNTPRVDSNTNRIDSTTVSGNVYGTYDGAGRMTTYLGSSYTYAWDALDMMTEMVTTGTGGRDEVYLYDANDERIATVTTRSTPRYRYTLRGPDNKVLREVTYSSVAGWSWTKDYVYRDGALLSTITPGPVQETVQHLHLDHLGSPRMVTDGFGAPVAFHAYYPFGGDVPGSTSDGERMKFTGHERDLGTVADANALDYMHARYYNSAVGRFLSVDPVLPLKAAMQSPQMWNRYAYVRNNPINAIDPDGRCEICLDNALGREQLAVVNGQMTMDQYLDIQAARFNGAMTGLSIVEGGVAVRSLVGLFTRGAAETLFENAAKREVLQSLREGAGTMSSEQRATVIRQVQRATTKESVSVVQNSNGTIQVLRSRPGRDGAQTFVTTVLKDGTEKTVQTAANAAGQTTHYDPKNAKTIWDTVKSWWYR